DVDVRVLESVGRDAQFGGAALDQTQRGPRAFLHHVANLAGEENAALARITQRFDMQDVPTGRCPGQAGDDAGTARDEPRFANVFGRAENPFHFFRRDRELGQLTLGNARGDRATDGGDLAFQFAHAGFAGVVVDDALERGAFKVALSVLEAVFLELALDE